MDFGLSDEQKQLIESLRRFISQQAPLDTVREVAKTNQGYDPDIHQGLVDLGIYSILVPEEYGGAGLTFLDAAVVQETLAGGVIPSTYLGTSIIAPTLFQVAGNDAQKAEWLPKISAGECRIGVGISELCGARAGAKLTLNAGKLQGKVLSVIDAMAADTYLVAVGRDTLALVDAKSPGLKVTQMTGIDRTRSLGELTFNDVACELMGEPVAASAALEQALIAGRIALAADTLGAAQEMLRRTLEYAQQREQFNRPIASFQSLKHLCADMAANLEPCRSLVWYAAHTFDQRPEEAALMACHAKAHLAEVGTMVARTSTEVFGGMGFTDLMGLHYWFKRIGFNRQVLGGPEHVRDEAAILQGWVPENHAKGVAAYASY